MGRGKTPHLRTERVPVSETSYFLDPTITDDGKSPKTFNSGRLAFYNMSLNYCRGFHSNRKQQMKLLTEYESATQKVLFDNAVLAALMSG
jgi:hypothetical protein